MKTQTWVNAMVEAIEAEKPKPENETQKIELSESAMNTLADLMIKKMSEETFDAERSTNDTKKDDTQKPSNSSNDNDETSLDE